jgi:hypothetical protein
MIKDVQEAKRVLGIGDMQSDEMNRIAFYSDRVLKEVIASTNDEQIAIIAKGKLAMVNSIYHDDGSLQEDGIDHSVEHDEWLCCQARDYIASNRCDQNGIEQRLFSLSKCNNAESKYLAALLALRISNDFNNSARALEFIKQAYSIEPYNPLYEDFYIGLRDNLKSISERKQREAEEKRRIAEEQKRRADREIYEREQQIAESESQAEREKRKKIIWTVAIIIAICVCVVSCS